METSKNRDTIMDAVIIAATSDLHGSFEQSKLELKCDIFIDEEKCTTFKRLLNNAKTTSTFIV